MHKNLTSLAPSIRLSSYQTLNNDPPARERPNNGCLPKAQWVKHKPIKISLFGAMPVSARGSSTGKYKSISNWLLPNTLGTSRV